MIPRDYTRNGDSRTQLTDDRLGLTTLVPTRDQGYHYCFRTCKAVTAIAPHIDAEGVDWDLIDKSNKITLLCPTFPKKKNLTLLKTNQDNSMISGK